MGCLMRLATGDSWLVKLCVHPAEGPHHSVVVARNEIAIRLKSPKHIREGVFSDRSHDQYSVGLGQEAERWAS
jgi:hypothetical protein